MYSSNDNLPTPPKKVAILFSGGFDSTATAVGYLMQKAQVFLITFDNGAQRNLQLSQKKANILIENFDKQCSFRLIDCKELFHQIAIQELEQDIKQFGNLVCCGCKLAMLAETILFSKKHHIQVVADGYKKGQEYYPEQTAEFIRIANSLAFEFGLLYEHPLYHSTDEEIKKITRRGGIPFRALQSSCLFSENPIRNRGPAIERYAQAKLPIARIHIHRCLENKTPWKKNQNDETSPLVP